jgi:hypothetical protein
MRRACICARMPLPESATTARWRCWLSSKYACRLLWACQATSCACMMWSFADASLSCAPVQARRRTRTSSAREARHPVPNGRTECVARARGKAAVGGTPLAWQLLKAPGVRHPVLHGLLPIVADRSCQETSAKFASPVNPASSAMGPRHAERTHNRDLPQRCAIRPDCRLHLGRLECPHPARRHNETRCLGHCGAALRRSRLPVGANGRAPGARA